MTIINKLFKITGHLHFCAAVPALEGFLDDEAEAHIDLKMVDRDKDGDPEFEVKWDLPGTAWDSGPEPKVIEIPIATLLEGSVSTVLNVALVAAGAPPLLVGLLNKVLETAGDSD